MKIKLSLLAFLILATVLSHAQVTPKTGRSEVRVNNESIPLLVVNGKPFIGRSLFNFHLDTSNISRLEIINPENNAVKLYGDAAVKGVILLETKRPIEWISTIDIYNTLVRDSSISYKQVLFKLNDSFFVPSPSLFIDKSTIKVTNFLKESTFFADKWFSSIISIELVK